MPSTMKMTNAERMITGNRNLSIFIRNYSPGVWVMVLQQALIGYPRLYCEYYRERRQGSLTKGNIMEDASGEPVLRGTG